jgi:hypothetical protein
VHAEALAVMVKASLESQMLAEHTTKCLLKRKKNKQVQRKEGQSGK